jgi:hypothetical protein
MKFWRNVGELVDIRAKRPSAVVINVGLGTELKEELMEVLGLLCDHNVFPSRGEREVLEEWISELEDDCPKDQDALFVYIDEALRSAPRAVDQVVCAIRREVRDALRRPSSDWRDIAEWLSSRSVLAASSAQGWSTRPSVRRGLAKLLVFGEPHQVLDRIDRKNCPDPKLGNLMSKFGWAARSIGSWRISDKELLGVLSGFSRDELSSVLTDAATDELRIICADLSSDEWLNASAKFLEGEVSDLGRETWVEKHLVLAQNDPTLDGQIRSRKPVALAGNWLFRLLMALIKSASGFKQGFGYEQLIGDVRRVARDRQVPRALLRFGISHAQLKRAGDTDSLRRRLVDWVSGLQETTLEDWEIALLAVVLAGRLSDTGQADLRAATRSLPDFLRRTTYEDRIAPYRFFEPLRVLIERTLRKAKRDFEFLSRCPTLVSEGAAGAREPGTTPVIEVGGSLIHWKSAHGSANTGHKTKELCGRAFALRHRLQGEDRIPVRLASVKRLCLVLDGDFTEEQVRHLFIAGWDLVLGPYDLNKLVADLR